MTRTCASTVPEVWSVTEVERGGVYIGRDAGGAQQERPGTKPGYVETWKYKARAQRLRPSVLRILSCFKGAPGALQRHRARRGLGPGSCVAVGGLVQQCGDGGLRQRRIPGARLRAVADGHNDCHFVGLCGLGGGYGGPCHL